MKQPIDPITLNSSWPWHPDWLPHHDLTTWTWSSPGWSPIFDITLQPGEGLFFPPGMVSWFNRREGTDPLPATGQQKEKSHKLKFPQRFYGQNHELDLSIVCWSRSFLFKALFLTSKTVGYFWFCRRRLWSNFPSPQDLTSYFCIYLSNLQAFVTKLP